MVVVAADFVGEVGTAVAGAAAAGTGAGAALVDSDVEVDASAAGAVDALASTEVRGAPSVWAGAAAASLLVDARGELVLSAMIVQMIRLSRKTIDCFREGVPIDGWQDSASPI